MFTPDSSGRALVALWHSFFMASDPRRYLRATPSHFILNEFRQIDRNYARFFACVACVSYEEDAMDIF